MESRAFLSEEPVSGEPTPPGQQVRVSWVPFLVVFYGAMGAVAVGISWWRGRLSACLAPWPVSVGGAELWSRQVGGLALAVVLAALVAEASRYGAARWRLLRQLEEGLGDRLPSASRTEVWVAAGASALGEELLFRGALLAALGPVWSTVLFAALHFPAERRLVLWPVFALVMGAALVGLVWLSGTILPAVVAHFLVNGWNLEWILKEHGSVRTVAVVARRRAAESSEAEEEGV